MKVNYLFAVLLLLIVVELLFITIFVAFRFTLFENLIAYLIHT